MAKTITKEEKSFALTAIKAARATLREPLVEATAATKAAEKELLAATKAAANRIKDLTKVRDTAIAKVTKFAAAAELGNAKLDAKVAAIEATTVAKKAPAPKTPAGANPAKL